MKKNFIKAALLCMAGGIFLNSCMIGSYALFNKLEDWNSSMTDNKYINALVGFVISPAYGICLWADTLVLNSIEFWTGQQPLASVGQQQRVRGNNGDFFVVTTVKDGYNVVNERTNETAQFMFDAEQNVWTMEVDGVKKDLFRVNDNNTLTMFTQNGQELVLAAR